MTIALSNVDATMCDVPCEAVGPRVFDHVMIDIETLSLHRHKALILSVGMIEFDPTDPAELHAGARDLIVPEFMEQIMLGRRVDVGTQEFWRKQDPEAAAHWLRPFSITDLKTTLETVRAFCKGKGNVWSRGIQFDLSNLEGLAEDIGDTKELWHYQAPCDMRGFLRHTPNTRPLPALIIPGVAHEPIYDCIWQAWQVWSHWHGN
jgi:hypothetical protein